jgi:DNA-binding NarL/FixJ family response regulator
VTVRRVLLVAENDELVDGIAAWIATSPELEVAGRAHSGAEAIDRAVRLQADLAIVDATLQDMSGYEATRALKSLRSAPRVLMMTFLDTRLAKLAALAAGADGLVATPEIPQRLLTKIAELFAPAGGLVETTQDGA